MKQKWNKNQATTKNYLITFMVPSNTHHLKINIHLFPPQEISLNDLSLFLYL